MTQPMKMKDRPRLSIPLSSLEKYLDLIAILGLGLMIYLVIKNWPILPELIPRHFGFSGKPDAWGSKKFILLVPVLGIVLYLGLSWLSRYPHLFNYPFQITEQNARRQYQLARTMIAFFKAELFWLFAALVWVTIRVSLDKSAGLGILFLPVLVILIFGTLGWFLYQSYRLR